MNTLGEQKASRYIFLNLEPGEYSNFAEGKTDNTHFQEFGAVEMSRLIVEGLEELNTRDDMTALLEHTKHRYPLIVEQEGANDSIITQGNAYPEGTPITLKTIAGNNDTFNAWYSVGQNVSDTNIYQITMPASRHTLVAAFNGVVPVVNLDAATVFIIGDSTVANYTSSYYPQTGWGQVLQPFFDDAKITIDNRAIGGTSSKSFYNQHWDAVKSSITTGDFVFIQFGINDRASDDADRYAPTGGVFEGFMTNFVEETIALGATPVLVSSVRRNQWDNGVPYDAYHEHPVVTRELAADLGVALIDLDAKNKALLESVGEDYANKFYYMGFDANEYPIYINGKSGIDANGKAKEDTVHFQEAGAVEIARLVREGISELSTNQALAPLVLALKPLYPVTVTSPTAGAGMFTEAFTYPENTPLTLKALPSAGNVFTQWLDNNNAELSTSSIYQLLSEDVAAEYTAVFNNSEGLGTPTSNMKIELQGTDVQISWDVRNYNDPITNLDLYRMLAVTPTPAPANKQVQRADSPLANSELLLANAPQTGSFVDTTAESGKTYTYFFRVTQGDTVSDAIEANSDIRVPYVNEIPVTNLVGIVDGTAIDLSWDLKYFNPDITYLEIYRNTINDTSGRVRISSGAPLAGSLRDEGLEPGTTYWYMFKMTQDGEFNNTDPEGEILIPIDAVPTEDPNAPTDPEETNLTTLVNGTDILVSWDLQNFYPEITYLELYRNDKNQAAGRTRVVAGATLSGTYLDENLEPGKTYWYMFKLTKAGVTSSTDPEAETLIPIDALPAPKTNLTAVVNGTDIDLTWDLQNFDPAITSLEVYRNDINDTSGRTRVVKGAALQGSFTDKGLDLDSDGNVVGTGLVPGTTYWYMFKITQSTGTTNTIPDAEVTVPLDATPSGPITNLVATANGLGVDLSWDLQNFDPEVTYLEIYRNDKNDTSGRTRVVKGAANTGTFRDEGFDVDGSGNVVDTGLQAGKTYWYMFKITQSTGTTSPDPEASVTLDANPSVPPAEPTTNLEATANGLTVDLSWDLQNFDPDVTSLEVYRNDKNDTSGRVRIIKGAPLSGSFNDKGLEDETTAGAGNAGTGLVAGKTYWYMFKITQSTGTTSPAPEASVTLDADPSVPPAQPATNLVATANGLGVDLSWDLQNFDPEVTYLEIYRNDKNDTSGRTRVVKGAANTGTFRDEGFDVDGSGNVVDTGLQAGKTYWYMFKITQSTGTTSPDPEAEVTIPAS